MHRRAAFQYIARWVVILLVVVTICFPYLLFAYLVLYDRWENPSVRLGSSWAEHDLNLEIDSLERQVLDLFQHMREVKSTK